MKARIFTTTSEPTPRYLPLWLLRMLGDASVEEWVKQASIHKTESGLYVFSEAGPSGIKNAPALILGRPGLVI